MRQKPTLYELLAVPAAAALAEIQAGYRREVNALEAQRSTLAPQVFSDRMQMLRLAYSTLSDPASRTGYDAKIQAAAAPRAPANPGNELGLAAPGPALAATADVRADALAMRADALSLRADAMLLRAGLEQGGRERGLDIAAGITTGVKRVVRAIGLLVVVGVVVFGIARCAATGSAQKRMAIEAKAAEQTALQEYFQAHGVRPANLAEMELMEAARRRQENEQRQRDQERRFQQEAERRFEEESRQRGRQVSEDMARQQQEARYRAERDIERERSLKQRAEQLKLEADLARTDADRRRLELQRKQTLEQLKQP